MPRVARRLLLALCAGCAAVQAQTVLVPSGEIADQIPSVQTASENPVGSVGLPVLRPPSPAEAYPLRWGRAQFHPHLTYQLNYGDGLLQGTNSSEKTAVQSVSPGVYLEWGRHWTFDTTISFSEYSNPIFKDNAGYHLGLKGHIPQEEWVFDFGYSSSLTEELQLETATQEVLNSHGLGISAARPLPGRLSLELGFVQDIQLSEERSDYWTWSTIDWLNYQATAKTRLGLGVGAGYNLVDPGTDWIFELVKARVLWRLGSKLSLQFGGGFRFVQFQTEGAGSDVFPLVDASVVYEILSSTTLSASANHDIENALEANQFTEVSTMGVALRQRLFEHFFLSVSPGYTMRSYESSTGSLATLREEDYFFIQAQLSTVLFKRLNGSIFYQFSDNESTDQGLSFKSNQVGLRVEYRY